VARRPKSAAAAATSPVPKDAVATPASEGATTSASAPPAPPGLDVTKVSMTPPAAMPVCAPTAAELAKEAGLSPAELRVLQSLQSRRGQLDQREQAMQTELALLSAAESKVDSKLKAFTELKAQVQALMGQADDRKAAEIDRLVKIYETMKPKDAAAVITQLDDKVRLPVAAKMKERALAAVLSQMAPVEAKKLTEKLASRFTPTESLTQAAADTPAQAAPVARKRPSKPAKTGA
jgi:flagellar motility protein MotE (MotC chaperone)